MERDGARGFCVGHRPQRFRSFRTMLCWQGFEVSGVSSEVGTYEFILRKIANRTQTTPMYVFCFGLQHILLPFLKWSPEINVGGHSKRFRGFRTMLCCSAADLTGLRSFEVFGVSSKIGW